MENKKMISRRKRKIILSVIWVLFIMYCLASIYVLFFGGSSRDLLAERNIGYLSKEHFASFCNLSPFHSIQEYLVRFAEGTINTNIVVVNLLGNILWFAPLGLFIPILFGKRIRSFWSFLVTMIIILLLIEILQFLTMRGSFDIDDIILNLAGACIFYGLTRIPIVKKKIETISNG